MFLWVQKPCNFLLDKVNSDIPFFIPFKYIQKLVSFLSYALLGNVGPLQILSFFMSKNPQVNHYKNKLQILYNYFTTSQNLYKNDLAAEPLQV